MFTVLTNHYFFFSLLPSALNSRPTDQDLFDLLHFSSLARHADHGSMGSEFDFTLGQYVENSSKLGIIVDFDGTLSPLARTPELAFLPPDSKKVLERLSNLTDVHVVVISGRELQDLREKACIYFIFLMALF